MTADVGATLLVEAQHPAPLLRDPVDQIVVDRNAAAEMILGRDPPTALALEPEGEKGGVKFANKGQQAHYFKKELASSSLFGNSPKKGNGTKKPLITTAVFEYGVPCVDKIHCSTPLSGLRAQDSAIDTALFGYGTKRVPFCSKSRRFAPPSVNGAPKPPIVTTVFDNGALESLSVNKLHRAANGAGMQPVSTSDTAPLSPLLMARKNSMLPQQCLTTTLRPCLLMNPVALLLCLEMA